MSVYISLLRGINVSGQKKIRMETLKDMYEALGYSQVSTYIQSGNVVFAASGEVRSKTIEQAINRQFGFEVPVVLLGVDDWADVLANNPFIQRPGIDESKLHVTFLSEPPGADAESRLEQVNGAEDEYRILDRQVYLHCPNGYGRTKYTNTNLEKKLAVMATTRNWKTANQLYQMARAITEA